MFYDLSREIEVISDYGDCPVCGSQHSSCTGNSEYDGAIMFGPPKPINDPAATFIVPERIFETKVIGKRKAKVLLYGKGAKIRPEEARRIGLLRDEEAVAT